MIGALLRMPVDAIQGRMLTGLHDAGFTDLVPAHLTLLRWPGPQGRRPSDLAKETRMSKQALNYLLRQLEELGYLERRDDPDDQRSKRIELTKRGRAAAQTMRATVRKIEREIERELGPGELEQLRGLLVQLNQSALVRNHRAPA